MIKPMLDFLESFKEKDVEEKFVKAIKERKVFPMTGAGIMSILNGTCKYIDDDKCYFEIGTHRGSTLIGAAFENLNTDFCGLDNFKGHNSKDEIYPFSCVEDGLKDAIEKCGHENVKYIKSDYISFFEQDFKSLLFLC